jgi:Protein of unknown function (DUF3060)
MSISRRRARFLLATAGLMVCAIGITACVTVNVPQSDPARPVITAVPVPTDTDDGRTRLPDDATLDCASQPVTLQAGASQPDLVGDCPSVTLDGADLVVRMRGADVGALVLRGDRITIDADALGSLEIGGQDNEVTAETVGALSVRGDRNVVTANDEIGAILVSGNDNVVRAEQLGAVEVSGQGNEIGGE